MKGSNREERAGFADRLTTLIDQAIGIIRWIAQPSLTQFMLRLALAVPFWKSGILKWNGFLQLNDTAIYLFTDEFKLHLPGGPYDFPAPAVMAFLSGSGEIIFPLLLVLGLGTRFAALGLLLMTVIVELTVPDGWPIHLTWAASWLGAQVGCRSTMRSRGSQACPLAHECLRQNPSACLTFGKVAARQVIEFTGAGVGLLPFCRDRFIWIIRILAHLQCLSSLLQ
jgi:putative oxidoreductase